MAEHGRVDPSCVALRLTTALMAQWVKSIGTDPDTVAEQRGQGDDVSVIAIARVSWKHDAVARWLTEPRATPHLAHSENLVLS